MWIVLLGENGRYLGERDDDLDWGVLVIGKKKKDGKYLEG